MNPNFRRKGYMCFGSSLVSFREVSCLVSYFESQRRECMNGEADWRIDQGRIKLYAKYTMA